LEKSSADLGEAGLNQLLCVHWLSAKHVLLPEVGLRGLARPLGAEYSMLMEGLLLFD